MVARLCSFVVWALVAATAVFWGLRLFVSAPAAPGYAVAVGDASATRADLSRVLGSTPVAVASNNAPPPEVSSRFKLLGIMAPKGQGRSATEGANAGVALIAVDGKPPKAFVVGSKLDGELVLQSVSMRAASLGPAQGGASVRLELPAVAAAATGTLPPVSNANNPVNTNNPPPMPGGGAPMSQRPGFPVPAQPTPGAFPVPGAPPAMPVAVPPQGQPQGQPPADAVSQMPAVVPPVARGDSNSPTK